MSTESPTRCRRIIVSDLDGTRWLLLLDAERAAGCITPMPAKPAWDRRGTGTAPASVEFSWRRRS